MSGVGLDDRRRRIGIAAAGEPDIVDRVLDGVEAGAFGKHPAGEERLARVVRFHLIDSDEARGLRLLGDGARHAGIGLDDEAAEAAFLANRNFKSRGDAGDLVEAGEDGNRIGHALGMGR